MSVLTIDGSFGEGGGQILRSSLTLSLVTGRPFRIERIRAGRAQPGLQRQHLAAVRAAAAVSGATVVGAELGSLELQFTPGPVRGGRYTFQVGTAGSATLVLQTVLPALALAAEPSELILEGGTHNPAAPPFDFLEKAYLPLLERMGPRVRALLERPGFYPVGGGRFRVEVDPCTALAPLELTERGEVRGYAVRILLARLPRHIAEREQRTIAEKSGWPAYVFTIDERPDSLGPGNAVVIEVRSEHVTEVFVEFGRRGLPAEKVALLAWKQVRRYVEADVPVGAHLADQLLLPLGIGAHFRTGGGRFRTVRPTEHTQTHIHVLKQFLDVDVRLEPLARDDFLVLVEPAGAE